MKGRNNRELSAQTEPDNVGKIWERNKREVSSGQVNLTIKEEKAELKGATCGQRERDMA